MPFELLGNGASILFISISPQDLDEDEDGSVSTGHVELSYYKNGLSSLYKSH